MRIGLILASMASAEFMDFCSLTYSVYSGDDIMPRRSRISKIGTRSSYALYVYVPVVLLDTFSKSIKSVAIESALNTAETASIKPSLSPSSKPNRPLLASNALQ